MSSLTKFLKEYGDPVMVLLIFFAWTLLVEVELWRNTGHVVLHWTVLQGPALIAILFYLLKLGATQLGKWLRADEETME